MPAGHALPTGRPAGHRAFTIRARHHLGGSEVLRCVGHLVIAIRTGHRQDDGLSVAVRQAAHARHTEYLLSCPRCL